MFTVERIGISVYSRTDRDKYLEYNGKVCVYSRMNRDKCLQ